MSMEDELYVFHSPSTGKVGYMNNHDEIIIPAQYSSASSKFNMYVVTLGKINSGEEKYALYDSRGNFILGFENNYEFISLSDYEESLIQVQKNGKYGYVNKENEIKIPIIYDEVLQLGNGLITAHKNGKYGFIDFSGNIIIEFQYEDVFIFGEIQSDNHKYCQISINGKYGFINENGQNVIPCIYDSVTQFHKDISEVTINEKHGVINTSGEILIPILYDHLKEDYETSQFVATINSKPKYEFIYDRTGIFIKRRKVSN